MAYRKQILCAYCDVVEASRCSRCGCRLCETHRPQTQEGWCWACAKEVKDELDIEQFKSLIGAPTERHFDGTEVTVELWALIASWVSARRQRRLRTKVLERTREQIEAWRAAVGIRTRW